MYWASTHKACARETVFVEIEEADPALRLFESKLLVESSFFVDTGVEALGAVAVTSEMEHLVKGLPALFGLGGLVEELAHKVGETVLRIGLGRLYAGGIDIAPHSLRPLGREVVVVQLAVTADKVETQREAIVEAVGRHG